MQSINILKNLPDINFFNTDVETLLAEKITAYQDAYFQQTGQTITLYPGDPMRIFLYTEALRLYQAYVMLDWSAKQNFLKYASGDYLDHIAATRGADPRNIAKAASVTMRFTLSNIQQNIVNIPAGTRVTAGDNVFFIINTAAEIPAGQQYADIIFTCTEVGIIGNDYIIGSVNTLVDPIPFIFSVSNTDISQGGAEIEADNNFMEKIYLSPEGFSVAGPEGAYIYRAKAYSQAIMDVIAYAPEKPKTLAYKIGGTVYNATIDQDTGIITGTNITSGDVNFATGIMNVVFSSAASEITATIPRGGEVEIRPLLQDAEIPDPAFLTGLKTALNDKSVRPLTDRIDVLAPDVINYDINFTYYINAANSAILGTIQTAVNTAVQTYILWQKSKIGRDINPSELTRLILNAGAKRVVITNPVFTAIENYQLAVANSNPTVTYGGLEND